MSSIFISSGADPYAHLRPHVFQTKGVAFEGYWATIELQPDVFARQRYTIGIVVASPQGDLGYQLLDDLVKFDCLFGKDYVAGLKTLIESAEQSLLRAKSESTPLKDVQFDSESICLGELWPTSGASMAHVVNRLYFDVVPFVPTEEKKSRDFIPMDNSTVRQLVDIELKRIAGITFERITTVSERHIIDKHSGEAHKLEFNLETDRKVGNVISAVYKTPDRVELNFLRASRDLATYARLRQREGLGIFVMTPAEGSMPRDDRIRIENVLDEQSWNLEKQGFQVSAYDDAPSLARDIFEWAEESLA